MNAVVFLALIPLLLLMGVLFLVGVINMSHNLRHAYKSGDAIYIFTVATITMITITIGWILGGLIG